jgi:hypothetical protein
MIAIWVSERKKNYFNWFYRLCWYVVFLLIQTMWEHIHKMLMKTHREKESQSSAENCNWNLDWHNIEYFILSVCFNWSLQRCERGSSFSQTTHVVILFQSPSWNLWRNTCFLINLFRYFFLNSFIFDVITFAFYLFTFSFPPLSFTSPQPFRKFCLYILDANYIHYWNWFSAGFRLLTQLSLSDGSTTKGDFFSYKNSPLYLSDE